MFIAIQHQYLCAPAERHVLWRVPLHAAPNGADNLGIWCYKHVAPTEQEPSIPMMTTFRASRKFNRSNQTYE